MRFRFVALVGLGLLSFGCRSSAIKPFELYSVDGKETYSSDMYKGKVLMLDFWATWCKPCREIQPAIREMSNLYGQRGVVTLGVTSESPKVVAAFVNNSPLGYPVVIDRGERVTNEFDVLGAPTVVIIDRDGSVAYNATPPDLKQLAATLDRVTAAK